MQRYEDQIDPTGIKRQLEPRDSNSTSHTADADQPVLRADSPSAAPLKVAVATPDTGDDSRFNLAGFAEGGTPISVHQNGLQSIIASKPNHEEEGSVPTISGTDKVENQYHPSNLPVVPSDKLSTSSSDNGQDHLDHSQASDTSSRRASIAETVLAVASTVVSAAASTVVSATMKLVGQEDEDDENLDMTEERDDQGLTFSQRHLSKRSCHKDRRVSGAGSAVGSSAGSDSHHTPSPNNSTTDKVTAATIGMADAANTGIVDAVNTGVDDTTTTSMNNATTTGNGANTRMDDVTTTIGMDDATNNGIGDAADTTTTDTLHVPETTAASRTSVPGTLATTTLHVPEVPAISPLSSTPSTFSASGADDSMEVLGTDMAAGTLTNPQDVSSAELTSSNDPAVLDYTVPSATDTKANTNPIGSSHGDGNDNNGENKGGVPVTADRKVAPTTRPLNVMYVAKRDKDTTGHHSLGVDPPAISKVMVSKAKHSGFGVDTPRLVDQPFNPKTHRMGSLHVDGKNAPAHPHDDGHNIHVPHHDHDPASDGECHGAPIQTSKDNSKVIHGNIHHRTGNTLPEARAAISKNPFEAHMSHHRGSTSSGLHVDHPAIPTSKLAGPGSTDNTNHNRPRGIYNSAINVDRPGSPGIKRSGMNVDGPATATHHLASTHGHFHLFGKTKTAPEDTSSNRPEHGHGNIVDKVKGVFHRGHSRSSSRDATPTHANISSSVPSTARTVEVPEGYEGPIPQVAPGDEIVWVKRTTRTDYYDDDQNEEVPASTDLCQGEPNQGGRQKKSGARSLLDRLRRRRHPSADKGKQRV
ncbi:hypothetical protein BGX31_004862 [Mortierella sp. GBA43]|nr:hypothetical protein BGX31_004862 [Mortierella sp. GBA43]